MDMTRFNAAVESIGQAMQTADRLAGTSEDWSRVQLLLESAVRDLYLFSEET